jgi:5-methylcytosine-specific restriction protein A
MSNDNPLGDISFFMPQADEKQLRREKAKARELRNSPWWKRVRGEGFCHYCSLRIAPRELTMDHIVPIIRGGKSIKSNIVPACKECNSKKKHMLPIEWDEYMNNLT